MSSAGVFTRNWRLKLAALTLAVLLWATMRLSDDEVSRLEIPDVQVRVDQVASDWFLQGDPSPATVDMTVTGPMGDLFRVAMAEPVVVIPVDSVADEDLVLELVPDWVWNVDRGSVAIEGFAPSTVRLLFEQHRVEEIPVSPRVIGRLPDSLALVAEPRANLLFAQVRGPASEVDALQAVFLQPFDLSTVTGPGRFDVGVDTEGLGGLVVNPMSATILVEAAARESRTLGPLAIELGLEDEELEVDPPMVAVTISGAGALLEAVDTADVTVGLSIDPEALRQGIQENGEVRVPVEVRGLGRFLEGAADADSVTVRRAGGL